MPVQLFDSQSGQAVDTTPDAAKEGVLSGTLSPQKTQEVHVRLADGRRGTISGHELSGVLAEGGSIVDPEAERHADLVKQESGFLGGMGALSTGAFEGATVGLGPGLVRKGIGLLSPSAGKRYQEMVEVQREAHPYVSLAGNVAGAAGAAYASKGLSSEAGAALSPAAAVDAIGAVAERTAASAVAGLGGEGALASAGRTAAAHAARAATESALFTAGQETGEQLLGDHEVAGEKVYVASAKGFGAGLFLGGGLGAAGSLVRSGGKAATKGMREMLRSSADIASEEAARQTSLAEARLAEHPGIPTEHVANPQPDYNIGLAGEDLSAVKGSKSVDIAKSPTTNAFVKSPTAGIGQETEDALTRMRGTSPLSKPFDIGGAATAENRTVPWVGKGAQKDVRLGPMTDYAESAGAAPAEGDVFGLRNAGHEVHLRPGAVDAAEGLGGELPSPIRIERNPAAVAAEEDAARAAKLEKDANDLRTVAKTYGKSSLHDQAADRAWDAAGASKSMVDKANARVRGGTRAVGETVMKEGILDTGGGMFSNTHESLLDNTRAAAARVNARIDEVIQFAGPKATTKLKDVLRPIDEEIAKLSKTAMTASDARAVSTLRNDILLARGAIGPDGQLIPGALDTTFSLQDLVAERRALQRKVFSIGDPNANAMKAAKAAVTRGWRGLEDEVIDDAASAAGHGPTGAEFKALNATRQHLFIYEDALEKTIAGGTANRKLSLTDHIVGHGAAMVGGGVGGMLAGPLGFGAGHAVAAGGAALLNKLARERGNAAMAVALTRLADIGAVKSMLGTVDTAVGKAAKGLTGVAEKPKFKTIGGSFKGHDAAPEEDRSAPLNVRYRDAVKKLDEFQAHPQSPMDRATDATKDLAIHAPNTAGAYSMAVSRAAAFLATKRPEPIAAPGPFSSHEPSVLPGDKLSFIRYFKASTDPMSVLQDFEKGVITPEATEALKATAPKIFQELQQKTLNEVAELKAAGKPLSFKRRVSLGLLFDIPTDDSLDPVIGRALQSNVVTAPPPQQPPSAGGKQNAPRRPVRIANQTNPLDRLSNSGPGRK